MTSYQELKDKVILIVEDDPSMAEYLRLNLEDIGSRVLAAKDVRSAERLIDDSLSSDAIDIAIVDLYIPEFEGQTPDRVMRGEELAYVIRERSSRTKIVGISNHLERKPFTPLSTLFSGFLFKNDLPHIEPPIILFETIEGILMSPQKRPPKIFIIHGHDSEAVLELKNFVQNTLQLGQPIILRERASSGRTIIEKFEKEARDVDIVFVLATPDDKSITDSNTEVRRSRQNVVFELGFFYAKLQRTSGKIIVLKKGAVDIPSDIAGVVYVDITEGISNDAGETIRRELQDLGWLKS